MLHFETVEPGTLSILKQVLSLPEFSQFSLVGGTALSLKYGHRISVDLDLFSSEPFEFPPIIEALEKQFGDDFSYEKKMSKIGIFCYIKNIKTDIIHFPHAQLHTCETIDGIRLYDTRDIAAMKINAILGRGKKKDFWDIYELLQHYSLSEIMDFHKSKYPSQMLLISIPDALTYFVDAEESEEPVSLKGQSWESVKKLIQQKVRDYLS